MKRGGKVLEGTESYIVCTCSLSVLRQLVYEVEDKIKAEAAGEAKIVYSGSSQRRQEGVICIWLNGEKVPLFFKNSLFRMLHMDEDILDFCIVPLPLSPHIDITSLMPLPSSQMLY
ncbi:hypothetical protein [Ktedonobacter robiniae]|uniref:Uncharacterized protein n=1 Tax=Ktedonobacter robiniae TaxID=2778365 RepID=A0ABQ3UHD9_9CHLR|nr:hypothetical protein [Ktedonobacter robiniae]GHO51835.1 hypothetical protein KSB_03100 [Ktedonobacter robiniae]